MNRHLQVHVADRTGSVWTACCLAFVLLAILCVDAFALDPQSRFPDYVRDNWNIESGLPQISALSITQDSTGYIWVGTQSAITRFDGVHFTVFDRDSTGVDTTLASVAYTDRRGEIWFGTPHGALHFTNGTFELLPAGRDSAAITAIADSSDGGLLLATSLGVMRYDNGKLVPSLLEGQPCYSLMRDGTVLWVGSVGGLVRIDAHGEQRYPLPPAFATARVTHLIGDARNLWIGTTSGLLKFADGRVTTSSVAAELDHTGIESLFRDSDANVWIGTAPMLFRVRPNAQLERIGAEDFARDSWVLAIYEDRERNLWLGSQTESLFRLWNGWTRRVSQRDGLSDPFVWSVVRDRRGKMFFGTNSNVVTLDTNGARELIPGKSLPNPAAYELYFDERERLWIGTRGGVAIYADQKLERPAELRALDSYQINAIVQSGEDDYWIGTTGGLYRYHADVLTLVGPPPGGTSARVRAIYAVDANDLLIGTETGVREVHDNTMETPAWAAPLDGRFISSIGPVRPGVMGLSTLDAGFALLEDGKLSIITKANGLPSDNGWNFRVINGWLYVAGIDGVWRMPLDSLPGRGHDANRALNAQMILSASGREPGSQRVRCCNGGASARTALDGTGIWLPTISGALRLDTQSIMAQAEPPSVVVEGLRNGGIWFPGSKALTLDDAKRDVEIAYTGLGFRDPGGLRFRYQLEGYDNGWVDAGTRRVAYYTNLPPGDYRFHVQVLQPQGGIGGDGALSFALQPHWYEIPWVKALLAVLVAGVAGILILMRQRRYERRQLRLERLVEDRTQALSRSNERLRQANLALEQASETDPLTGLRNRRF
ncbi:MAG: two-component regulator propeller domain-containing protein, partial [Rudaea sp.]